MKFIKENNNGASNHFNVFPNPATEAVNVVFEATASDYAVSLSDLQGRTVASQTIEKWISF